MSLEQWTAVSDYLNTLFPEDRALAAALENVAAAGLPAISVTPAEGRLLHLLARCARAARILEIGTLGGYSTIWLARALLPGGRLITLEMEPKHAEIARTNLQRAGVSDRVDVRVGPALQILPSLPVEFPDGFDLIFIDADKQSYPDYWHWSLQLSHAGTLIIADNVVRGGQVANLESKDADVLAVRTYLSLAGAEPRVHSTVIQTVGSKGYDGISLSLVLRDTGAQRG